MIQIPFFKWFLNARCVTFSLTNLSKIAENHNSFIFDFIEQHCQQVCPSTTLLASERKCQKQVKILYNTCSAVRGFILLAIQDGTAEYLEPHANLASSNLVDIGC